MAEIIRMPRLSDTMEEGNIVSWLVKEGDDIKVGDILAEVETDKATMELESFNEGSLLYIGVKEGPVAVDGIIAIIGKKGEDYKKILEEDAKNAASNSENGQSDKAEAKVETTVASPTPAPASAPVAAPAVASVSSSDSDDRLKASPLAKKIAEQKGIPISQITGSGEGGRVIKRDVENYTPSQTTTPAGSKSIVNYADFEYGDHTVSQMRKTIARRLSESKFGAPHFYLTIEINMDAAVEARKAINELAPPKVSFNDMVVKAAASSLRKNPQVNGSWHGDKITYHKEVNVGVAVAVEDGLVVPVIRDTDQKSLSMINTEVKALAGKARDKKLSLDEMQGNTFTISNLGMFGIEEFTAIINPPDACIMAVGAIIKKAVVVEDAVKICSMMKVTLSCDHRIVDGAKGAEFLKTFKEMLENPVRMLV